MGFVIADGHRYPCVGVVTIGRGQSCTIRPTMPVGGAYISRLHGKITIDPPTFEDLSEQGSYVNGSHVFGASIELHDGDQIKIGDAVLVFSAR